MEGSYMDGHNPYCNVSFTQKPCCARAREQSAATLNTGSDESFSNRTVA